MIRDQVKLKAARWVMCGGIHIFKPDFNRDLYVVKRRYFETWVTQFVCPTLQEAFTFADFAAADSSTNECYRWGSIVLEMEFKTESGLSVWWDRMARRHGSDRAVYICQGREFRTRKELDMYLLGRSDSR